MRTLVVLPCAVTSLFLLAACTGSSGGPASRPPSSVASPTVTATRTVTDTPAPSTHAPTSSAATSSAPNSGATHTTASHAAAPGPCSTADLRLVRGVSDGAAGTNYTTYELINTGAHSCTLYGYPGVSVIDDSGHIVLHAAERGLGIGGVAEHPTNITVAAGAPAKFMVSASSIKPNGRCAGRRTGSRLRVYPPNQKASLVIRGAQPFQACDLRVGPVYLHDR